ncbi:hypothetical protein V1292_002839 [Bradyrhizobium sp. AZCC 1719]|uniref:hypothetical protein n=1 Tax=Bradyrhizobium sp. AZCC 1719 TaxID=3117028 RepID=UPI002FF36401
MTTPDIQALTTGFENVEPALGCQCYASRTKGSTRSALDMENYCHAGSKYGGRQLRSSKPVCYVTRKFFFIDDARP